MKSLLTAALIFLSLAARADAQPASTNAALRYWMAFAVMKDPPAGNGGISLELLDRVAAGLAPFDDRVAELLYGNREALAIMQRAAWLPSCDWGLEYELGPTTPIAYLAKGRVLGRLNMLAGQRLAVNNQWADAVYVWIAGVRFSQHLAQGGSLIAVLSARAILRPALNALVGASTQPSLSPATRLAMADAVRALPEAGFDWDAAMKREENALAIYRRSNRGKGEMPNAAKVNLSKEETRADIKRAMAALSPASAAPRGR